MTNSYQVPPQGPRPVQQKRKTRWFTWFILGVNVLFLVWVIAGVSNVASSKCDPSLSQTACDGAKAIGGGIGAFLIIFLWVAADVILGIIWLVTRKKQPTIIYVQDPQQYQQYQQQPPQFQQPLPQVQDGQQPPQPQARWTP